MDRTLQLLAPCQQHLPGKAEMYAGCFRIAENNEKPPGWCLTCIRVSGLAFKGAWGALSVTGYPESAPYLLLYTCVLCYPTHTPMAETQLQWPGGQEFCWKFLGEVTQFLCANAALFAFIRGSYTWVPNVFLFIYSATGSFKTFFSFPVEAGVQTLFSSPYLCLLCAALFTCRRSSWWRTR